MNAPDKATEIKALITAGIAFLTALWGWVGWAIAVFMSCMVLDYLTGTWAAKSKGEWSSAAARAGLWHKLGEIAALLVAALCDIALKVILNSTAAPIAREINYSEYLTLIVAIWYALTEIGSILENIKKLGAPIPDWLVTGVSKLKAKADTSQGASTVAAGIVATADTYMAKHLEGEARPAAEIPEETAEEDEEEDAEKPPDE